MKLCSVLRLCFFFGFLGAGPSAPTDHLRKIFYGLGLDNKEVVALFGHVHLEGLSLNGVAGGKPETKYTDGESGVGDGGAPAHPTVRCSRAKAAMTVAVMSLSRMASMAAARKSCCDGVVQEGV